MFALGTFEEADSRFVGLVVGDRVMDLSAAEAQALGTSVYEGKTLEKILADWPRAFDHIYEIVERLGAFNGVPISSLRALPPVPRPGKILNAAANYRDHAEKMREAHNGGKVDWSKDYGFDKTKGRPYLFLRASSTISGAFDPVQLPAGLEKIDWEAELGVVIGPVSKHLKHENAMDAVAGYVITNDISCRNLTWREDRPALRSDWLAGKSFDSFAPTGPYFVPRQFVPEYRDLEIRLWVNGELKQHGLAGQMIFNIEDQLTYASKMMTLEPGDLFATGTPSGTGQEHDTFLKAGDVIETEISGLGRQCNVVVSADEAA